MVWGVSETSLSSAVSPFQKMERSYILRTGDWELHEDLRKMFSISWGRPEFNPPSGAVRCPQWAFMTVAFEMKWG
jgi:hypothetical protein